MPWAHRAGTLELISLWPLTVGRGGSLMKCKTPSCQPRSVILIIQAYKSQLLPAPQQIYTCLILQFSVLKSAPTPHLPASLPPPILPASSSVLPISSLPFSSAVMLVSHSCSHSMPTSSPLGSCSPHLLCPGLRLRLLLRGCIVLSSLAVMASASPVCSLM
jgi:hypothetical protein